MSKKPMFMPNPNDPEGFLVTLAGVVILAGGILAVYRLRSGGYLKLLKRWPTEIV